MCFVWLEELTMLVNNIVNLFSIIRNIILYYVPFMRYIWISKITLVSIGLKSTEKRFTLAFNPIS